MSYSIRLLLFKDEESGMNKWFGKNCIYLAAQWEDDGRVAGPDWVECEPVLVFCNHPDNEEECEGNCREKMCPLKFTKDNFEKGLVKIAPPLPGTFFSEYKKNIFKALQRSEGQCPCVPDPLLQSIDTICPCKVYRETLECKCNLYVKDSL